MHRKAFLGGVAAVLALVLVAPPAAAAPRAGAAPDGAGPAAPSPAGAARHDRGRLLQSLLEAEHAAGMPGVFAQVRDGRRVWRPAAGVADIRTGRPVRSHFQHRVGSITKTFVATTVLQLVGERRLRLDAPIGRYLPDVVRDARGRTVTVRMLLNHTSGIGNYTEEILDTLEEVEATRTRTYRARELAAIGLSMSPTNAPGAAFAYSNTNYILLGLLVERVTGRSVATEVSRRILRPLGLRHTYFPGTERRIRGPHARAYVPWPEDGQLRDFSVSNMTWAGAAGALVSTPADLNRFFRALLQGRLLRPAQQAALRTTVPMVPDAPQVGGYGLGIYWLRTPCGTFWGHDGGVIGHTTISLHSPDGRRQVSLAENLAFYQTPGELHPIDEARGRFLDAALCPAGGAPAAAAAAGWPAPLAGPAVPALTRAPGRAG
ncbi:MAG TPA: serine hydrolase domain-containing protein [Pilimelia sp.]|nr:serine hydrolase domain-containing protein [Pilimelia sp.]